MTKRAMVKKFRRETGADKKTAMDYLMRNNWNYGIAIGNFNISKALDTFGEPLKKLGDILRKIGEANKEDKTDENSN